MIEWARDKKIKFILDESFVDFAEEENSTFLDDKLLNLYEDFIVVKKYFKILWSSRPSSWNCCNFEFEFNFYD